MKKFGFIFIILSLAFVVKAQSLNYILLPPQVIIHFGSGDVSDVTTGYLPDYERVYRSCPSDGYYSYSSYTSHCFNDDWHTISADHTAGDTDGNMLLVNAGSEGSVFLNSTITGLKSNTEYEFAFWIINLCRPTKKCPYLLLPALNIRLETTEGKIITNITLSDIPRVQEPVWAQSRTLFTTPAIASTLRLVMADIVPGGCGNDFALDDITFREVVRPITPPTVIPKTKPVTKQTTTSKPSPKKNVPPRQTKVEQAKVITPKIDTVSKMITGVKPLPKFAPAPVVLKTRENALVREFETGPGEIQIKIYDNGEIDGDTVSIYHNNELIRSHIGLSQKPISINIGIDPSQPHHELIMVADNLGSIPPNTSVMIITTTSNRYEVFISSSKQKNAKVVFDLKK